MAWISVHDSIDGKKLRKFSKALGCSLSEATGLLVYLWQWGLENADKEGEIEDADRDDVASIWAGKTSENLSGRIIVDKLIETGWIDDIDGCLYLHDWDQWQDPWYKALDKRKRDVERKRKQRQSPTQDDGNSIGQSAGNSTGQDDGQSIGQSTRNRNRNLTVTGTLYNQDDLPPTGVSSQPSVPFTEIMKRYNEICVSFPKIKNIDGQRRKAVAARWRTYQKIEVFEELFQATEASNFMKGDNDRNWNADFDWIMKPTNFSKVLEGKYANKGGCDSGRDKPRAPTLTGFKSAFDDDE